MRGDRLRFWLAFWLAADASRAYRRHAAQWCEAGFDDYAEALEYEADVHDREWDLRLRGFWAA